MDVEDTGEPRAPLLDTPYAGEGDFPAEYQEMSGENEQDPEELQEEADYTEQEQPLKQLYIPIDLTEASELFPPAAPAQTMEALSQAILERSEQLTPSPEDQAAVNALLAKVTSVLEAMAVRQEQLDGMAVEEIKSVGAHKKGTLLAGQKVAEAAIILKDWPTYEAGEQLGKILKERLTSKETAIEYTVSVAQSTVVVSDNTAKVIVMVTCFPQSVHEKQNDNAPEQPKNGVALSDIDTGLTAIRHTRWFDENVSHTSVKILARLLKDLSQRTPYLNHLTAWHCELLAHFCILSHSNSQPLSVPVAFKRFLQLMSAGFFMPDSVCIDDPCETGQAKIHQNLTYEQMEDITWSCQSLLRLLTYGAYREILGLMPEFNLDLNSAIEYGGITISPPQRVLPLTPITTQ